MLNVEKGFYQTETTLKVMQIELIETYHVYRKRKREERDEPSAPLNNKKRKGEFGPPIVDDMSLCSGERSASSNGSISVSHYDVQEYEGAFMEFYDELEESISRFQSQLVEPDPVIEEKLTKVRGLMDRLWLLFKAIQDLTGSDELVVIIRFVDLVKRIISAMDEFAPRFPENGNGPRKHNILLPTYIFNRFMENRR
jgi:hypothetical protein